MHIPDGMLSGAVCPVTLSVSAAGLLFSAYSASKKDKKTTPIKFAAVTSAIFVLQMLNFPISHGTSGHFLGAAFAALTLGVAPGILAMSLVIAIQAILFGDGGLMALGANILSMSVSGVMSAALVLKLRSQSMNSWINFALAGTGAFLSVLVAAIVCSLMIWIDGKADFQPLMTAMTSVHILIGVAEAISTVLLMMLVSSLDKTKSQGLWVTAMLSIAAIMASLASNLPDGLEYTADKLGFMGNAAAIFSGFIPDYAFHGLVSPLANVVVSSMIGVLSVFVLSVLFTRVVSAIKKLES